MGYFNPITYFLKSLIRIFTRKFFWVFLFCICLFLGFIIFNNNGVFAVSNISFNESYITSSDISYARSKVGDTIWNDETYDIFIHYNAGTGTKCVTYFKPNLTNAKYVLNLGNGLVNNYRASNLSIVSNGSSVGRSSVVCKSISNSWSETLSEATSDTSVYCYTFYSRQASPYSIMCKPIRTHFDIFDSNNELILNATNPVFFNPYILNSNEISNWSFDTLNISLGSVSYDNTNSYYLSYNFNGVDYGIELRDFYNESLGYFVIPRNQLTNNIVVRNSDTFNFTLIYRSLTTVTPYDLGTFTISITSEEQEQINQDSDKSVQGQILEQQQQTNNKLDNIDNTITDSNIDDITNDTLPSDNTNDITSEGVNGIFTSIYNAFCTGQAQDIVFPIPFTNKNITLSPSYVSDMLNNNGASWVVLIIQAFWWYLISRFIIKDVMNKINKIKSGNIEDIETTNIRGDML